MPVNNSTDTRINSRSPYYIEAGREAPAEVEIPDPVEDNTPPTVVIQASNETPTIGQTVTLTAVATDSDGTIVSYLWGGSETTSVITVTSEDAISITYFVTVTDDDGDTGSDSITIHWQEPAVTPESDAVIGCGDEYHEGAYVGVKTYRLDVGNGIGDVTIELLGVKDNRIPVKFDLDWNGNTATTGYVGYDEYGTGDDGMQGGGDDNTSSPSTKGLGTSVTVNKTAATPTFATLTARVQVYEWGYTEPNDRFDFRLVCPDVTTPVTFFYTLTNDCDSGSSTITYLDVNGVTQTVVLAENEVRVVSAQEDSVIETVCDTIIDEGDESFDLGKPDLEVNNDYAFTFLFDDSASFKINKRPIQDMVYYELKETMLKYYGNSSANYNSKFRGIGDSSERMFSTAATFGDRTEKSVVCILWNEAEPNYHRDTGTISKQMYKGDHHDEDVLALRNMLDGGDSYGDRIVILFSFKAPPNSSGDYKYKAFQTYLDRIENGGYDTLTGTQSFWGNKGFSDRSDVIFVKDIPNGQSSAYYHDLVVQTLRDNGFQI